MTAAPEVARFVDAAPEMMPALGELGLVTAALAVDLDRDGWVDLLTASEWGPGSATTTEAGGSTRRARPECPATGFWNSLAASDFDHDGDLDIVRPATSASTPNTSNRAPTVRTSLTMAILMAPAPTRRGQARGRHTSIPSAASSCSSTAMPFIAEKFGTLQSCRAGQSRRISIRRKNWRRRTLFTVTEFQSGVFVNDGGTFSPSCPPRVLHSSPRSSESRAGFHR